MEHDLVRAFLSAWRGPSGGAPEAALGGLLASAVSEGAQAWPGVAVDAARFAAYLGARAPVEPSPVASLQRLRAGELYLCCACVDALPAALRAFDDRFLARLPAYLSKLRATRELIEEAQQVLRARLLVSSPDVPARLAQYNGLGSLEGFVRVAAVRVATDLRERAESPRALADPPVFGAMADEELSFIERRYRGDFAASFREALGSLVRKERNLLRLHYLERLPTERIAVLFDVHRTTVGRWLLAIEAQLLAETRARLTARLGLTASECDSIIGLVQSRLHITLHSALRDTKP